MKTVIFYEKPGCKGNARQKALPEAAGFTHDALGLDAAGFEACQSLAPGERWRLKPHSVRLTHRARSV